MSKVFIVLDEREQQELERLELDRDPQEALEFVLKRIVPKAHKAASCSDMGIELHRTER